jgi:DNA-binding NarL/FixJ family response regulator
MPYRILIVEEDWLQAESLEELLMLEGHTVCATEASGERAVTLAASLRPDLVVMDVRVAGRIDGIESAIRITRARPDCGVVFITGDSDEGWISRMQAMEHAMVVLKPATVSDIRDAITRVGRMREEGRGPHASHAPAS